MLLNSVVIVLREVLEAALMMSVLLAGGRFLRLSHRWAIVALGFGLFGAVSYGYLQEPVSNLFEGVGQEVCNAMLQIATFVFLAVTVFAVSRRMKEPVRLARALPIFMATAVALAITREGAEILVYVSGFWAMNDYFSAVGVGSLIGACIGCSVGVLIYFLLLAQPAKRAMPICIFLLILIAAGMSSQATRLLIQADWLTSAGALWNTSAILPEDSLVGQLLYALIGYEASPAAKEIVVHVGSMLLVATLFFVGRRHANTGLDRLR